MSGTTPRSEEEKASLLREEVSGSRRRERGRERREEMLHNTSRKGSVCIDIRGVSNIYGVCVCLELGFSESEPAYRTACMGEPRRVTKRAPFSKIIASYVHGERTTVNFVKAVHHYF